MAFTEVLNQISPTLAKTGGSVTPAGGTDDLLTSGNSVKFTPRFDFVDIRHHSAALTRRVGIPTARRWDLALQFYLSGSGALGTAAVNGYAAMDALMQAGAMTRTANAGTSLVYTPMAISSLGTSVYATIWNEQHGLLHKTYNAIGNPVFEGTPSDGMRVTWTGQGDYERPTSATISNFTGGTDRSEAFLNIAGTITPSGGTAYVPVVSRITWNRGVTVGEIEDSNSPTGIKRAFVRDATPSLTLSIAADSDGSANLTYNKLHADYEAKTVHAVVFTCGQTAAARVTFSSPQCQIRNISRAEGNGYQLINVEYNLTHTTDNNEFTITIL